MDADIVDSVTEWESVTGPRAADLQSLADEGFSGAVTAGPAWAFLLNGRVVGLFDGGLEEFESDLTAYRAPDPALPLLYTMRETGGETRGKYYSEETSLREVDRTLSSGNFTGYVELSENVLSGDYYVVYHGGRSMSVAFVGASKRLVTGDEAFDLADDEVGIFSVNAVDVSVVDLPESAEPSVGRVADDTDSETGEADDAAGPGADADAQDDAEAGETGAGQQSVTFGGVEPTDTSDTEAAADIDTDTDTDTETAVERADSDPDDRYAGLTGGMGIGLNSDESDNEWDRTDDHVEVGEDSTAEAGEDDFDGAQQETDASTVSTDDVAGDERGHADQTDPTDDGPDDDPTDGTSVSTTADSVTNGEAFDDRETAEDAGPADVSTAEESSVAAESTAPPSTDSAAAETRGDDVRDEESNDGDETRGADDDAATATDASVVGRDENGVFSAERRWQQATRIPALAPDDSMDRDDGQRAGVNTDADAEDGQSPEQPTAIGSVAPADPTDESTGSGTDDEQPTSAAATTEESSPAVADLEARIEQVQAERDDLAERAAALESDLESVTRERDRLRARVADLESELSSLREAAAEGDGPDGERLSVADARKGTNLLVRYQTKGKPTLKKAEAGEAKQSEVVENLSVEYHTTFESEMATVDGEPYESFLVGTTEWQFATWVVEELLYEIGRSGHRVDMAPLFDRIADVDRIEFDGTVPVTITDEDGDSHESRTFDLVFWDSMGDPLFVASVGTSRNATTQESVESLIEGARAVGESKEPLGAAFYVSTSFFEPGALTAVEEATKSGLLSRTSKQSFVKLSRKQGYHLCLVEARDDGFNMKVPEL